MNVVMAQVNGQSETHHFKLSGGDLNVFNFYMSGGDTVYERYELSQLNMEDGDSILFVEIYNSRKEWFVYRYLLKNGQPNLSGWQQEYSLDGYLTIERYCEFGSRHCNVMKKYSYYPGEQLNTVASYLKTELHGYTYFYYSNGQLRQTVEYNHGKLWNVLVYFDQDGSVLDAGNFKDGNGTLNVYSMNGKIIQQKVFVNGKLKKKITVPEN